MKTGKGALILTLLTLVVSCYHANAQQPQTALEHMEYLSSRGSTLSEKYMSYMSAVAHSRRAKKMEKRRAELVAEIKQDLADAGRLKPYKGDASLKDAYKKYWDLLYKVFNDDYHKIVNMEEIAEQSYDAMEAYMTAQQQAAVVVENAGKELNIARKDFGGRNNIRFTESTSKMGDKLDKTKRVTEYYNKLYLMFFKVHKQESYMNEAFRDRDVNAMEQSRKTLIKYAEEGMAKLDTLKPFEGDASLKQSCRKMMEFYKREAEVSMPSQIEYILKRAEFDKLQKTLEATPANKRTQADVDTYNKAVNAINNQVNASNKSLNADNETRSTLLEKHQAAEKNFLDTHVPSK
jgi:hypothetical protein